MTDSRKIALVTGCVGQDGSILVEQLLKKDFEVHGIGRNLSSSSRLSSLAALGMIGYDMDLSDVNRVVSIIQSVKPRYIFHLAGSSFVDYSFDSQNSNFHDSFAITHAILSEVKENPEMRFLQAGSSEMFGEPDVSPQTESSRPNPKSLYGISKVACYYLVKNYRERMGVHASTAILYNHESVRRSERFVTRKIVRSAARIKFGLDDELRLGCLDAIRDWGYAPEYVEGMRRMVEADHADDYILATGVQTTVREFVDTAFSYLDLNYLDYVVQDTEFYRPPEAVPLLGCANKIYEKLGWKPYTDLSSLIGEMVNHEVKLIQSEI